MPLGIVHTAELLPHSFYVGATLGRMEDAHEDDGAVTLPVGQLAVSFAARMASQAVTARKVAEIASFPVTMGGPPPKGEIGADGMLVGFVVAFCALFFFTWLGLTIHLYRYRRRELTVQQPVLTGNNRFRAQMAARIEQKRQ